MAIKRHVTRNKKDRNAAITVFVAGLLSLVLLVTGGIYFGDYLLNKPIKEDETVLDTSRDESGKTDEALKGKQVNILLVGIDSGTGRGTNLTDVIMVVNLNLSDKKINILQIPRDTYVGYDSVWTGKMNGVYPAGSKNAYGNGINGMMNCISDKFKIPLDYYATVNLDGFRDIVQAMGGVKINLPKALDLKVDKVWYHFPAGQQTLTPKQAEVFVRERNSRGSDIGRVKQGQRVFMAAMMKQLMGMSKTELLKLAPTVYEHLRTDLSLATALTFLDPVLQVKTSDIVMDMVPGEPYYDRNSGQSLYSVHTGELVEIVNKRMRANMEPITEADLGIDELQNSTNAFDDGDANLDEVLGG